MDLTQSLRPPSRLTTLPAEIRVQIYSYLFDSWTLHIDCARAAPVAAKEDDHTSGGHTASRHAGLNLRVHAVDFPLSAFLTCRSLYADFKGLGPLPVGKLHVSCDLASAYVLRARFGELLDELRDRVDCLSARTLEVNQDGIYGLDIALVKGRMAGLKTIEVGMRDLAVNAQYAPGWVRKALEMEGTVVRNAEGDKGWESSEFAFGYLHSFLGWEMPTKERLEGNGIVRLRAKQEITIWAERKCLARMVSGLHIGIYVVSAMLTSASRT